VAANSEAPGGPNGLNTQTQIIIAFKMGPFLELSKKVYLLFN